MPDYCADSRSAARHHILTFKGSRQRSRAVAGLRCRLGSSYQKAPRSEPNFAKLIVSTPTKSTICDRLGYQRASPSPHARCVMREISKNSHVTEICTQHLQPLFPHSHSVSECE